MAVVLSSSRFPSVKSGKHQTAWAKSSRRGPRADVRVEVDQRYRLLTAEDGVVRSQVPWQTTSRSARRADAAAALSKALIIVVALRIRASESRYSTT